MSMKSVLLLFIGKRYIWSAPFAEECDKLTAGYHNSDATSKYVFNIFYLFVNNCNTCYDDKLCIRHCQDEGQELGKFKR